MIARDLVRVKCRIKSIYRSRGVQALRRTAYSRRRRVELLAQLPAAARSSAERLYEQYDFLVSLKARAHADLITESHKHAITRILETAPGMGPIRVAQLVSIVVTPHRFRTKRQFWSYCGLSIVMRRDWGRTPEGRWIRGRVQQTRGLTRQHNHTLKEIFKGAATTVVTQPNTYAVYAAYEHMTNSGTKPNLAKVTLARMIAAIVLRPRRAARHPTPAPPSIERTNAPAGAGLAAVGDVAALAGGTDELRRRAGIEIGADGRGVVTERIGAVGCERRVDYADFRQDKARNLIVPREPGEPICGDLCTAKLQTRKIVCDVDAMAGVLLDRAVTNDELAASRPADESITVTLEPITQKSNGFERLKVFKMRCDFPMHWNCLRWRLQRSRGRPKRMCTWSKHNQPSRLGA
jgi:hypothetical protein